MTHPNSSSGNGNGNHNQYHVNTTGSIMATLITPEVQAFYVTEAGKRVLDHLKRNRKVCTTGRYPAHLRFDDKDLGQSN